MTSAPQNESSGQGGGPPSDGVVRPAPATDSAGSRQPIGSDGLPQRPRGDSGDPYELSDPSAAPPPREPAGTTAGELPADVVRRPAILSGSSYELAPPKPANVVRRPKAAVRRADPSPRVLILFWVLWLLGSWGATFGVDPQGPVQRWMIFSAVVGLMVLWPVLRLSQDGPDHEGAPAGVLGRVLLDWISLNLVMQTVIWPLHMIGGWSFPQTLWLDAALASWSLLTGVFIAAGCRSSLAWRRVLCSVMALGLLVGEPLAMWLVNLGRSADHALVWTMRVSPLQTLWHMTTRSSLWEPEPWATHVLIVASAAVLGWIGLAMFKPWHRD